MPRVVTILGATGSIGVSTLQVLALHRHRYQVFALTAYRQMGALYEQICEFKPVYAVVDSEEQQRLMQKKVHKKKLDTIVLYGEEALVTVASHDDVQCVMSAIVGSAALLPTMAAVQAGKTVLLANKESLVMAGQLMTNAARESGATLLPVDSEHNALFQCFGAIAGAQAITDVSLFGVDKVILTASGGPFRDSSATALQSVTPEQACRHPNWNMGKKISVDSASMMNKGLEVIEACWLFALSSEQVDVVVHPQSIVHGLVQYVDGSSLAQLGYADMRTPIAYALAWPNRHPSGVEHLNLAAQGQLDFFEPDNDRFPCLSLAKLAFDQGKTASIILNASNEIAVDAFLNHRLAFMDIATLIDRVLSSMPLRELNTLDDVLQADSQARDVARDCLRLMQAT